MNIVVFISNVSDVSFLFTESYKALAFYQSSLLKDSSICDICTECGCQ